MTLVEATMLVVVAIGLVVLGDRARHPGRYAPLEDPAWLRRSLLWVAGTTTVASAAAILGGSGAVAQVVVVAGMLAFFFLLYMLSWAMWRPR